MKAILITLFGLLILRPCYAGKGKVNEDEEHNCIVFIRESGVVFNDLHGHVNEGQTANWHHYSIFTPQGVGKMHIQNRNGRGDADLYVNNIAPSTLSNWICRPFHDNNDEACIVDNLIAEKYNYVSLNAANSDYTGSDLVVNYNLPSQGNMNRTEGFGWPANSLQAGTVKSFSIWVPDGLKNLNISTTGSENTSLTMIAERLEPQISQYTQFDSFSGSNSMFVPNPDYGAYTVNLHASTDVTNVHLKIRYNHFNPGAASAINDVPQPPSTPTTTALTHNQWHVETFDTPTKYFHIDVPENKSWLKFSAHHFGGDMDMYIAHGRIPTITDYDCRSIKSGLMVSNIDDSFGYDNILNEECRLPVNGAARYYAMLTTYKERYFSQAKILANYSSSSSKASTQSSASNNTWSIVDHCSMQAPDMTLYDSSASAFTLLENYETQQLFCIPDGMSKDANNHFRIRAPSTSFKITIKTDHGTGDGNLYVNELTDNYLLPNATFSNNQFVVTDYTRSSINSNNRECLELSVSNYFNEFLSLSFIGAQSGASLQLTVDDPMTFVSDSCDAENQYLGSENNDSIYGGYGHDEIHGGPGDDYIFGREGNDVIYGGPGRDKIRDGDGDDRIFAEDGNDEMHCSFGADILDGGLGIDIIDYYNSLLGINISLDGSPGVGGCAEGDKLKNIETVKGSNYDDALTGNAERNTIHGRGGNDVIRGNTGNDALYGDEGDDTIYGGDDNDVIRDGEGNDQVFAEGGNDEIYCSLGADILDGGLGIDIIDYYYSPSGVNISLDGSPGIGGYAEGDKLNNIEKLKGSNHDDVLAGNAQDNFIYGKDGDDHLSGSEGYDYLIGGIGNDSYHISINDGKNRIKEDASNNGRNDTVIFGAGISSQDLWFNRKGNDLYVFIINTADYVIISDWFSTGHLVEKFQLENGLVLLESDVQLLVDAMTVVKPVSDEVLTIDQSTLDNVTNEIIGTWKVLP